MRDDFLPNFFLIIKADFTEDAIFVLNQMNNMNLIHGGYEFRKHREIRRNGQTYWYCRKHDLFKCKVKAYTMQVGVQHRVRITGLPHSHPPEQEP